MSIAETDLGQEEPSTDHASIDNMDPPATTEESHDAVVIANSVLVAETDSDDSLEPAPVSIALREEETACESTVIVNDMLVAETAIDDADFASEGETGETETV